MSRKESAFNAKTGKPPEADDLKLINGIGPAVEKRLNGVGVFTFAQLAVLSPADIAAAVADLSGLSAERIMRQDWISQAHKLAAGSLASESVYPTTLSVESDRTPDPPLEDCRLATFTIELQLDEHNNVLSTHALHVQSERKHTWTGWQRTQLEDFLSESAGLNLSGDEPALLKAAASEQMSPVGIENNSHTPSRAKPELNGTLHVCDIEMIGTGSRGPHRTVAHDHPFDVRLTLDLSELQVPGNTPLHYKTSLYSKGHGRPGLVIGEAQGAILADDRVAVTVGGNILQQAGTYKLAATVILGLPTMKLAAAPGTTAIIDGGLLEVY